MPELVNPAGLLWLSLVPLLLVHTLRTLGLVLIVPAVTDPDIPRSFSVPLAYGDLIATMRTRGLTMICANPDVVVERGEQLVYCAGAIADLYGAAGGDVIYAGKPYRPIYDQALAIAEAARGRPAERHRVLAIGDSVRTDLKGAAAFGIDCLFVTAGIHAEELGARDNPDAAALGDIFAAAGLFPKAVMHRLAW